MGFGRVFIAVSLDGFIAGTDGAIDWLAPYEGRGEDHGYDAFIEGVDGIVMGRRTFETATSFPSWPYEKPVVVMTRTLGQAALPERLRGRVRLADAPPSEVVATLRREGWRHAYVDGGRTISAFLGCGEVGRIVVTIVPILLGSGTPLFAPGPETALETESVRAHPSGLVTIAYRVRRADARDAPPQDPLAKS